MYDVIVEKSAIKELERIPKPAYGKIKAALFVLAHNPRPLGYLKLKGREGLQNSCRRLPCYLRNQ